MKLEKSQSHHFAINSFFFVSSSGTNFFIHSLHKFVLKKSCEDAADFLQLGACPFIVYENIPFKCL